MFAEKQVMQLPGHVSAKPLPSLSSLSKQLPVFVMSSLSSSQPVSLFVYSGEPKPTYKFNSG